jgi:hypothetical protein
MIEIQIFIPLKDNQGQPFSDTHHEFFEAFVMSLFGGVTRLPEIIDGKWLDQGTVYQDYCSLTCSP